MVENDIIANTEYVYPTTLNEFNIGDEYEIQGILTNEWSTPKVLTKFCYSVQSYLQCLIDRKGVRIIKT